MNEAQKLMAARLGYRINPSPLNTGVESELVARGGALQQDRMIQDKRKTLDRVVWFSYQGAFIQKVGDTNPPVKGLINPNKLKQDYDEKILSIGFEYGFHSGDVFKWCDTDTHWLVILQDLTELAYFRGEIRRCRYKIEWLDDDNVLHSTYAAVRGPVETKIDYIQKHKTSIDNPNYTLNMLVPSNDDTLKYFKRYSKFYLQDNEMCWRVEGIDSISTPGILEINAKEYYANEFEDDEGIVGKLIVKPDIPSEGDDIIGPTLIKPKVVYRYEAREGLQGQWSYDQTLPIVQTQVGAALGLKWDSYNSAKFTLSFGTYKKDIVVESLF